MDTLLFQLNSKQGFHVTVIDDDDDDDDDDSLLNATFAG